MSSQLVWSLTRITNMICNRLENKFDVFLTIEGKRGLGKTQPKGNKVLLSNGEWKKVEEIKKGDELISPQKDGTFSFEKVIETHKRYENEIYNVVEKNRKKRKLYSVAGNHDLVISTRKLKELPKTKDGKRRRKSIRIIKEIEARELVKQKRLKTGNSTICNFTTTAIDFKNNSNPKIDAYTLGVYLGDGSFTSALSITTPNKEIISEVTKHYPYMNKYEKNNCFSYRFSKMGNLANELKQLGLEGKKSGNKFIPQICKKSPLEYRRNLLAGLIDADGYVMPSKDNHISITTKSKQLSEDIKDLVFSLGGYSSIKKITKKCQNDFIGNYFEVSISFKFPKEIPLKCNHKKERLGNEMAHDPRYIAIDLIPSKPTQVFGFEITGQSQWYITDNWIITHNSTLGFHLLKKVASEMKRRGRKKQYRFLPHRDLIYRRDEVIKFFHKRKASAMADEMINVSFNRDFYNQEQKDLIKMINMNRDHNNFFIACVPSFKNLDGQMKNLCSIKITVVRRGTAILHFPNKTIYSPDIWDEAYNGKIERKWLENKARFPAYRKLSTFKGYIHFPPLKAKDEEKYQAIKDDKRNVIAQEKGLLDQQEEEEKEPRKIIYKMLVANKIKSWEGLQTLGTLYGMDIKEVENKLRYMLAKDKKSTSIPRYFTDSKYNKKLEVTREVFA